MKSLLNFIIKYSYAIAFVIIEILCFVLIFTSNNYHKVNFLNSSNTFTAYIEESWTSVVDYTKLKKINDSIVAENEKLHNTLEKYRQDDIPAMNESGFEYISAKLVSATVNRTQNSLTINKGKKHNIEYEMGVVGPNGIIGIVNGVSNNYSSIMPIIHPQTRVSVKLEKNDYFGSLSWNETNNQYASLSEIPDYVKIEKGDVIVTSGFSAMFPEGIPVGTIHSYTKNESTKFYNILVELYTDFNNISYVYVISNINQKEQNQFNTEEND